MVTTDWEGFTERGATEAITRLVRGAAPADIDAVVGAVTNLSVLADALGDRLGELDVNPLIAGPDGCIAVDALVVAAIE